MGREATFFLLSKACASPVPTAGAGTRRSRSRPSGSPKPATRASSGKATKPDAKSAIATWKSSPISTSCRHLVSRSRCFPGQDRSSVRRLDPVCCAARRLRRAARHAPQKEFAGGTHMDRFNSGPPTTALSKSPTASPISKTAMRHYAELLHIGPWFLIGPFVPPKGRLSRCDHQDAGQPGRSPFPAR